MKEQQPHSHLVHRFLISWPPVLQMVNKTALVSNDILFFQTENSLYEQLGVCCFVAKILCLSNSLAVIKTSFRGVSFDYPKFREHNGC